MESLAAMLEGLALAEWLRYSRWSYAALNASHILGLCLLVGSVAVLDLRLLGLWKTASLELLYPVLAPVAATGLGIAVITGSLLFSVRATEYIQLDLFFVKLGLVVAAAGLSAAVNFKPGVARLSRGRRQLLGAISLLLWLSVLACGRLLAFI